MPSAPFPEKLFEKGQRSRAPAHDEPASVALVRGQLQGSPGPRVPALWLAALDAGQNHEGPDRAGSLPWGRCSFPGVPLPEALGRGDRVCGVCASGFGASGGCTVSTLFSSRTASPSPAEFAQCIPQIQMKNAALEAPRSLSGICLTLEGQTHCPARWQCLRSRREATMGRQSLAPKASPGPSCSGLFSPDLLLALEAGNAAGRRERRGLGLGTRAPRSACIQLLSMPSGKACQAENFSLLKH